MSIGVAGSAALREYKLVSGDERPRGCRCVFGRERIRTELEIVRLRYFARIGIFVAVFFGICRGLPVSDEDQRRHPHQDQTCEPGYRSAIIAETEPDILPREKHLSRSFPNSRPTCCRS